MAFVLRNRAKGLGAVGIMGLSGYGAVKLGVHLKSKHDAEKKKEFLNPLSIFKSDIPSL